MAIENLAPRTDRNLRTFFLLTGALSLPPYAVAALVPQEMVMLAGLIIALAPVTAALILVWREEGAVGVLMLLKRCVDVRSIEHKVWYAPILLLMPVLFLVASGMLAATGESVPAALFPAVAAPIAFLIFFLFALFEEIGWMGYAFGPMAARRSALTAGVLLGTLWAAWHIPLYLLSGQGPLRVVAQLVSLVALRSLIVWLFSSTGASLFAAILTHAVYNVCTLAFPSFYTDKGHLIASGLIVVASLVVGFLWRPETMTELRHGEHRPA